MVDIATVKAANAQRWTNMVVAPTLVAAINNEAQRLVAAGAKERYQSVAQRTSVPWAIIAVIHDREASGSWKANLAQGDPWNAVSIHVPKGRGPFASWEDAAIDALTNCAPRAATWSDWSIAGALTLLEEYNGLGYAVRALPSPYIWASTDQYVKGKFVADGHFDPDVIDRQIGCAPLIKQMITLDGMAQFFP